MCQLYLLCTTFCGATGLGIRQTSVVLSSFCNQGKMCFCNGSYNNTVALLSILPNVFMFALSVDRFVSAIMEELCEMHS